MFRFIFVLFLSLFLTNPAFSQQLPPPLPPFPPHPQQLKKKKKIVEPPPTRLVWEIRGIQPPNKNILFIIDTSGSMDGIRVQSAIKMAMSIAEAPVDDMQIALVSFGSSIVRWAGTDDIDPRTNKKMSMNRWAVMPSKDNLDKAYAWLQANRDSGVTNMLPAINHSLKSCGGDKGNERVKELSIIIISDGAFGNYHAIKIAIKQYQKKRIEAKLPHASIGFIGVGVRVGSTYDRCIRNLIGEAIGAKDPDNLKKGDPKVPTKWRAALGALGYCRIEYIKEDK